MRSMTEFTVLSTTLLSGSLARGRPLRTHAVAASMERGAKEDRASRALLRTWGVCSTVGVVRSARSHFLVGRACDSKRDSGPASSPSSKVYYGDFVQCTATHLHAEVQRPLFERRKIGRGEGDASLTTLGLEHLDGGRSDGTSRILAAAHDNVGKASCG